MKLSELQLRCLAALHRKAHAMGRFMNEEIGMVEARTALSLVKLGLAVVDDRGTKGSRGPRLFVTLTDEGRRELQRGVS